jgi:putative transposase
VIAAIEILAREVGVVAACDALRFPRATWYRRNKPPPAAPRPTPERALAAAERRAVLDVLHSDRFVDVAPAAVYATLLDDGTWLCSVRTMYRLLAEEGEVRERRDQLRHPVYTKPELLAVRPRQVWSWDITKLKGPVAWTYFHLYVVLDIFSRYVVGWLLADRETAALAEQLISEACAKESIDRNQLTIHSDRGTSMTSKTVAQLLAELDVTRSLSRPHVSNDNPFSESQFKTMKYRPSFPRRFGSFEDAQAFCRVFFPWYNTQHRHSGIAFLTPADVHHGRAPEILAARQATLAAAYVAHPERFVGKPPVAPKLPENAWINSPSRKTTLQDAPGTTRRTSVDPGHHPLAEKRSTQPEPESIALTPPNAAAREVAALQ